METDEAADTYSELSTNSSEYCSEPDDDQIQAVTANLSRDEFESMDNQSIVSGIPGPTEKVACSTLIETPDKRNQLFQSPASVTADSTQFQLKSAEIMKKLDKILEILSQFEIRAQPYVACENLAAAEKSPRQSSPSPLPQITPMQRSPTTNPVVNDAMLAETLRLQTKSSSAGNLATKLFGILFKQDELII